ncbi:hypothetical protein AO073_22000 [Pseudomonas syringae ICMP 11293]|nr:hypothetical protein AO073_22000 [Pseudomonas syringae ICMP 11293]
MFGRTPPASLDVTAVVFDFSPSREPKQRIEQAAGVEEQGPQRVGQREHQMLPGTVGQTVVLHGDPLVGGLFAAGRTGPAMAGVAQVFDVRAMLIGTGDGVFIASLNAADLQAYRTRFPAGLDPDSFDIQ